MNNKKAMFAAEEAHKGQFRKGGSTEYVVHPFRVANIVKNDSADNDVIDASYLHDVMEDCPEYDLSSFSPYVLELVDLLTKKYGETKSDAVTRASNNPDALLIKMADRLDNYLDDDNPEHNKEYLARKSVRKSTGILLSAGMTAGLSNTKVYNRLNAIYKLF